MNELKHKPGQIVVGAEHFLIRHSDDYFFKQPRDKSHCESLKPSDEYVEKTADYPASFWMKNFFDGTIDMSLQTNRKGYVVLKTKDSEHVKSYHNPLRDPILLVKRDGMLRMRDGYHRLHEAKARGYNKKIWCVILDMVRSVASCLLPSGS